MSRVLFNHQIEASEFLASDPGTLLIGAPGTGKTFAAIEAMHRRFDRFGIITCPAIATSNWVREFALAGSPLNVVDAKRHPKRVAGADVLVISQDSIRTDAMKELAYGRVWDVMIADEAHGYADPNSQRTQAAYSPLLRADKTMLLTGTPTPRHAAQLWTQINRTASERLEGLTYGQFADRYCKVVVKRVGNKRFAERVIMGNKPQMMDDLRARLEGWWLRQRKEDVLKSLPPKTYAPIELSPRKADLRAMQDEIDPEVFEAIEFAVETGDVRGLSLMSDQVSKLRRLLAKAKVKPTLDYVLALVEITPDVLPMAIWGWHTEPLHQMQAALREKGFRVGLIDGATPLPERDRIVEAFQAGELDFFVGQIKAAGIAITLTRSSRAVFLEESFNPSDNEQASDRCIAQGQPVLTPDGWRAIETIEIGDSVMGSDGLPHKVTDAWSKGAFAKTMVEVAVEGWPEPIVTTHDHRFLLESGEWVEAQDLKPRHRIASPRKPARLLQDDLLCIAIPDGMLHTGEFVGPYGKQRVTNNFRPAPDQVAVTDEFLFMAGYYLGDGYCAEPDGGGGAQVRFAGNHTTKLAALQRIEACLHEMGASVGIYDRRAADGTNRLEVMAYGMDWTTLFRYLFGTGSHTKHPCAAFGGLSARQARIMLDGYAASDGHTKNGVDYEIASVSKDLMAFAARLAWDAGLHPRLRWAQSAGCWYLGYTLSNAGGTSGLVRSVLHRFPRRLNGQRERVYDLTVDGTEDFVVGPCVVHNCHRIGQLNHVQIDRIILDGTIDGAVAAICARRADDFEYLTEGV